MTETISVDKLFTIDGTEWIATPKRPRFTRVTVYAIYHQGLRWGLAQQLRTRNALHSSTWAVMYWPDNDQLPAVLDATANSLKRAVEILHVRVFPHDA